MTTLTNTSPTIPVVLVNVHLIDGVRVAGPDAVIRNVKLS